MGRNNVVSTEAKRGNLLLQGASIFSDSGQINRNEGLNLRASLIAQSVKNLPAMQETQGSIPGWEDSLEKEIATHSSILAWRIPWTEEPGRLWSMGSQELDKTQQLNHHCLSGWSLFVFNWEPLFNFLRTWFIHTEADYTQRNKQKAFPILNKTVFQF